jgi:hypothetical protein
MEDCAMSIGKEKTEKSTSLSTAKTAEVNPSSFRALSMPTKQIATLIRQNMGTAANIFDLDRVKVPAGGSLQWTVPTLKGQVDVPVIEGILLMMKDNRSYWDKKFGTGGKQPPNCSSTDMRRGIGMPGGDCQRCPFSQYGSAIGMDGKPGRGQACKHIRMALFLRQEEVLPIVLLIPPSSVKNSMKYGLRLASAGVPYSSVVTQLRLTRSQNAAGIDYSTIDFAMARILEPEEIARSLEIAKALKDAFMSATIDAEAVPNEEVD